MKTTRQFDGVERAQLPASPVHLAIGMFDGVHLGHQSVIESAIHSAKADGGLAGVMTFWPHPSAVVRPDHPTPLIQSCETKRRVLSRLGLDFIIEQHFTKDYAAIGAREFVPYLLKHLPQLKAIYVGENWRFGRGREGDVALLVEEAKKAGLTVVSADRLNHNGAAISSSRIRTLLEAGEIAEANALLGYSYFAEGKVQGGRRLGREIGFPTLNLAWEPELKPRYGVYAVSVVDAAGRPSLGVANYGLRPTIEETRKPLLEVHVLGDTKLGEGSTITVHWLSFLRPEKKFAGVEELRAQIAQDRQHALGFFARVAGG
ncbi:MAG TPA: riboflavin biosynthesis protein RibF [Candidatus Didemnitutus sp.]|nr:riboflavin biosynthesis protein RibF [Candidatus Didemnitutus sp.]